MYMESDFGQYIAVSFRSVKRAKKFQLGEISQEFRIKFFDMCIKVLDEKLDGLGSNQKCSFPQILEGLVTIQLEQ